MSDLRRPWHVLALACLLILLITDPVLADKVETSSPETTTTGKPADQVPDAAQNGPFHFLRSADPSYFVLARDEKEPGSHIEFFLSIEYPLFKELLDRQTDKRWSVFFEYSGKYDFYISSRHSSPVVSRLQNPGLFLQYSPDIPFHGLSTIRTGYFHESNGQTIDTVAEYRATEYASDYISRGWDYLLLELEFNQPVPAFSILKGFYFTFRGRYFLPKQLFTHDKEDEIFWEKLAEQPRIEDYDGLRFQFEKVFHPQSTWLPDELTLKALFRSGYHDYNLSQRYEITVRVWGLPLYIYYFKGYGTNISTYQEKGTSYGLGFEFL